MPLYTMTDKNTGKTIDVIRSEEERDDPYTNPDDGQTYHRVGVEETSPNQHTQYVGLKPND
jgi:hypothetical protein